VTAALNALIIAGGILVGRLLARAARSRKSGPRVEPGPPPALPATSSDPFAGFPCTLGDVVVRRAEGDEAWLAAALLFTEDRPVAALFVAPDAGSDRAVFVRDGTRDVLWLLPMSEGRALPPPGGEPPAAIESRGARYVRRRRLPVNVEERGAGTPKVGRVAILAEYAGSGADAILLVVGAEATRAWEGVGLPETRYDVLPGGASNL
jgi:hypothetical protein